MLVDYHIHLERGPYDLGWLSKFIGVGRERGVKEFGIVEHSNRFREFSFHKEILEGLVVPPHIKEWLDSEFGNRLEEYVELILRAKEEGLPVKLGLEVDYLPGREEEVREALGGFPWDYIIGSVHFLGRWPIDFTPEDWDGHEVDRVYEDYFNTLARAAKSGLFDVLAHPDLVKLFGHRPRGRIDSLVHETVEAIASAGVGVEVNTAGLRRPVRELYPSREFLVECFKRSVPITLGSDAHLPGEAGQDLDIALQFARSVGYREIAVFQRRERRFVDL